MPTRYILTVPLLAICLTTAAAFSFLLTALTRTALARRTVFGAKIRLAGKGIGDGAQRFELRQARQVVGQGAPVGVGNRRAVLGTKRGLAQFGDRNGMTPALAEQILRAAA